MIRTSTIFRVENPVRLRRRNSFTATGAVISFPRARSTYVNQLARINLLQPRSPGQDLFNHGLSGHSLFLISFVGRR